MGHPSRLVRQAFLRSSRKYLYFCSPEYFFSKSRLASTSRGIALKSAPSTSGILERGNCYHAITRETGKNTDRAITRVAGKESRITLARRAKSIFKSYLPATTRERREMYSSSCTVIKNEKRRLRYSIIRRVDLHGLQHVVRSLTERIPLTEASGGSPPAQTGHSSCSASA